MSVCEYQKLNKFNPKIISFLLEHKQLSIKIIKSKISTEKDILFAE